MATFGEEIRKARIAKGLSLREVAESITKDTEPGREPEQISLQYLNDMEHGRRNPPSDKVIGQLAKKLDLKKDYLVFLAGRLPSDVRDARVSPEKVEKAFAAFRKDLRPR